MNTEPPEKNGCRPGVNSLQSKEFRPTESPPSRASATEAGEPTIPLATPARSLGATGEERSRLVPQPFSAFGSVGQFEDAQRMATLLAHSSMVPASYRGEAQVGDCMLALEIANRIGASILAVMQNLRMVHGRPAWSSQFLISCVNASRRFSPLRYQMTGTRGADNWGCIAWAFDPSGQRLESPEVTLKMAKQEGWYYRAGSKWRTLPELMLRYRSATWFARLYAPEITMGIQTIEEVMEMNSASNASVTRPNFEAESTNGTLPSPIKWEPRAVAAGKVKVKPNSPDMSPVTGMAPKGGVATNALATPGPAVEPKTTTGHYHYLKALKGLIGLSPYPEVEVLVFLRQTGRCDEALTTLEDVATEQPEAIVWTHDHWNAVERELTRLRKGRTP